MSFPTFCILCGTKSPTIIFIYRRRAQRFFYQIDTIYTGKQKIVIQILMMATLPRDLIYLQA